MTCLIWMLFTASFFCLMGFVIMIGETIWNIVDRKKAEKKYMEYVQTEAALRIRDKINFERLQREIGGGKNV